MTDVWENVLTFFTDGWIGWIVVAAALFVYGVMTLTLRVAEPTDMASRLRLAQGNSGDTDATDDAVRYRSTRMVLTSVRTASVISMVIASLIASGVVDGDLLFTGALVIAGCILVGLIVYRALLNRLADSRQEDVAIWLAPVSWAGGRVGALLPLKRLVNYVSETPNGSDALVEGQSDVFAVLQTISTNDLRASDLMRPLAEVVAVSDEVAVGEMADMMIELGLDRVLVYGSSVDDVRGTVSKADVLEKLRNGTSDADDAAGILRPVFALTATQYVAKVAESFRGREDRTAIVLAEDSKLEGVLSYDQLMRRLLNNGV